jgi:hypothetical protein
LNWKQHKITDIEIDGVDRRDYPNFADAYCSYAYNETLERELTDSELEQFTEENSDVIHELAMESIFQC